MARNDVTRLYTFLCQLSASRLRSLKHANHSWLPRLQDTVPERLATAICTSIYPSRGDSEEEFLKKLAWLYSWLIPRNVHGFPWVLYRRNGPSTPSEDFSLHERFIARLAYPGCRMTHAMILSMSAIYCCVITTDPEIQAPDGTTAVCLTVWPGLPFLGVSTLGRITTERLDRALRDVLPGIPQEQLIATYENFESMYGVVIRANYQLLSAH
ncbi:hypothetical protein HPB52_017403 [Rhipicephalus sanguineus]|uniref:Uncharacterized protein n=1 Tax=Rhipicephalus sanguineus TaxID=34632 RepID=A0A9D4TB46_RHISA|nr:hypothetical protein HPB52_017403 [Rhipicephalus sanguineus]